MAPARLDVAGQRGGLHPPLPLLLLSITGLAMLNLVLGTTAMDVTSTMSPTHSASLTPVVTSALLPTSASTTVATVPPSSPETGAPTLETFSTSLGTKSTSLLTTTPPTASTLTTTSADPLTTLSDTTAMPDATTRVSGITSDPSQPAGTTARSTPGISTLTVGSTLGTPMTLETPTAATGMEASSPDTDSTQTPEVTLSTTADASVMPSVCPSTTPNTSTSHLFLSLRLTVPLDLRNTTVQELVLSKIRGDLQRAFPCTGLAVKWRGQKI